MIQYEPFGVKALNFIQNPIEKDARITILEGSVRSGKTVAMIPKWINYILNGPPGLLAMTGVSKDTIYDNVLRDLFDTIGDKNYSFNRQTGDLLIYGRQIKVIGAKDEGSEKYLRGKTLAGAYSDETTLMPEKFFKQLLNRLSVKGSKLYCTTNPDTPSHYIYKEFIDDKAKIESGMVNDIHFELDDNPNLDEEYKSFIRSAYTGFWYLRMIEGRWVQAQGSIYDMWDENLNTFTDEDIPVHIKNTAQRYISIDYGTTNPMVFLDCWDDGDTIWILKEYYYDSKGKGVQKTDSQYADDLDEFIGDEYPRYIIIDPSAASFKAEVRLRRYRVKDADNAVLDGIRMMSTLLAKRKLKVHKANCPNFQTEIVGYVWDEKAALRGVEQPLKVNDHCMDACKYMVKTMVNPRRLMN